MFPHKNSPSKYSEHKALGRITLKAFDFEGHWGLITGLRETEISFLESAHKTSHALEPSAKQ